MALILGANPSNITKYEGVLLFIQGFLEIPISLGLLSVGPTLIPASEVSLYMLIETVLGPVFVWLGGYEAPPTYTIYGGAILLATLAINRYLDNNFTVQHAFKVPPQFPRSSR